MYFHCGFFTLTVNTLGVEPCLVHLAQCQLQIRASQMLVKCCFSCSPLDSHASFFPVRLYVVEMHLAASNREPDYSGLNRDLFFSRSKKSVGKQLRPV